MRFLFMAVLCVAGRLATYAIGPICQSVHLYDGEVQFSNSFHYLLNLTYEDISVCHR